MMTDIIVSQHRGLVLSKSCILEQVNKVAEIKTEQSGFETDRQDRIFQMILEKRSPFEDN